jgi:hypothetical protein
MVAFFGMIVEAFTWVMVFFGRVGLFFSSQAVAQNLRFAIRLTLLGAFKFAFFSFVALLVAFAYFALQSLVKIYNLISQTINYMQGISAVPVGSASPMIDGFYYFIHVSGIADAITNVFPIIASALTFVLMRNAYRVTLFFYKELTRVYVQYVNLLTAS